MGDYERFRKGKKDIEVKCENRKGVKDEDLNSK